MEDRILNLIHSMDAAYRRQDYATYYTTKDMIWAARNQNKSWPGAWCWCADQRTCCQHLWHHAGDCCIHCGMDNRGTFISAEDQLLASRREAARINEGVCLGDNDSMPSGWVRVMRNDSSTTFASDDAAAAALDRYIAEPVLLYSRELDEFGPRFSEPLPAHWDVDKHDIVFAVTVLSEARLYAAAKEVLDDAADMSPEPIAPTPAPPHEERIAAIQGLNGMITAVSDMHERIDRLIADLAWSRDYLQARLFHNGRGENGVTCWRCGSGDTKYIDARTRVCTPCTKEYGLVLKDA